MAFNAQQGLQLTVSESGAVATAGKLNAVATSADRVGRAAGTGAAGGIGRLRQGLTGLRSMASGLIGTFARVGGLLGIGGGLAIAGLLKETTDVERALHQIAWQSGKGAAAMKEMRRAAEGISGATGKSRTEVLSAIMAAEDMGLSFEQAQKHMQQLVLWSDLLGVSADQASGAVGAVNKALGGKGDIPQIMSMLNAGALKSGMDEGAFMGIIQKVAPQLQGVEGIGDITSFMQAIGGLGSDFGGDVSVITKGFKSLNKTMNDEKLKKSFKAFGIQGNNASELLISIAQKLAGNAHSLDAANLPDEVMLMASAIADNLENVNKMGKAVQDAAGDAEEFSKRVSDHAKDPEVAWAGTMERLKIAMDPVVNGVLNWFLENNDGLINVLDQIVTVLGGMGSAVESLIDNLAALFGGPTSGELKAIQKREQGQRGISERNAALLNEYRTATDPKERARIVGQMAALRGEEVENEWSWTEGGRGIAAPLLSGFRAAADVEGQAERAVTDALLRGGAAGHSTLAMEAGVGLERGRGAAAAGSATEAMQRIMSAIAGKSKTKVEISVRQAEGVQVEAEARQDDRTVSAVPVAVS